VAAWAGPGGADAGTPLQADRHGQPGAADKHVLTLNQQAPIQIRPAVAGRSNLVSGVEWLGGGTGRAGWAGRSGRALEAVHTLVAEEDPAVAFFAARTTKSAVPAVPAEPAIGAAVAASTTGTASTTV